LGPAAPFFSSFGMGPGLSLSFPLAPKIERNNQVVDEIESQLRLLLDETNGIGVLACLAQSGNPITFSAIGGGTIRFDFDDSQIPVATRLVKYRDSPLWLIIVPASGGELVHRHGGKREGAGRKRKDVEPELSAD